MLFCTRCNRTHFFVSLISFKWRVSPFFETNYNVIILYISVDKRFLVGQQKKKKRFPKTICLPVDVNYFFFFLLLLNGTNIPSNSATVRKSCFFNFGSYPPRLYLKPVNYVAAIHVRTGVFGRLYFYNPSCAYGSYWRTVYQKISTRIITRLNVRTWNDINERNFIVEHYA